MEDYVVGDVETLFIVSFRVWCRGPSTKHILSKYILVKAVCVFLQVYTINKYTVDQETKYDVENKCAKKVYT